MMGSVVGNGYAVDGAWMTFGDSIVEAELTGPERRALYADVARVQSEREGTMKEAADLIELRIGGAQNLRSYVDSLMLGIEKP